MNSSHESNKDFLDNLSMGAVVCFKRSSWLVSKDRGGTTFIGANATAVYLRHAYVGDEGFVYVCVLYKQQRMVVMFPSGSYVRECLEVL